MIIQQTTIAGLYMITLKRIGDERGYFMETFRRDILRDEIGVDYQIKQMSRAFNNRKGTLRGMHYQKDPYGETKLISCVRGAIYDVALDLRPGSKTYGKWATQELSEENNTLFFIPKGFAHGYQTLTENTLVQYSIDEVYHSDFSTGVRYDDPSFGIKWPLDNPILSVKDSFWPLINTKDTSS